MSRTLRRRVAGCLAATMVALGLLATVAPTGASAELQHPRQQWMRDSTAGLFLHWGMRTSPGYTSCTAWENAVTNGGWDPDYWVAEAQKLHAQYLVFASFHSRLGYARAWPSSVPGSCTTRRDFLGELITAARAQGLRVLLYMTDDPQWFNEGLGSGQSWLNSSAYSAYKGRSVNLHTRDGFGEYSYDVWVEAMRRYADLAGFWVDNDNAYWERNGLYERVRAERPTWTLSNNNEDTPIMDTISNEQKTGMTPSYDYAQAVYTPAPRLTEACFKLPTSGAWWYDGSNPAVDRRLTLGRLVSNAGSSVKSLMAETAHVNGRFPANQEAFNNFADGYLDQIWGSIAGTEGGGYMYGGFKPGFWNDGAHGVTTVSKANPNLHFLHVLTRPSGSTLRLRDNGYRVTRVTNFRTGAALSFSQAGGSLTVTGVPSWDTYDTVFQVETSGREGIYPPGTYTTTASSSAGSHPGSHATDGSHLTYWDSNRTTPVSLTIDLGEPRRAQYLAVNQREWSPTYPRSTFGRPEDSARIRDYRVSFSANGTSWGTPVRTGTMPSHRGVQFIDLPGTSTRYLRLEVLNTWSSTSLPAFQRLLGIDEARVGSSYVGAGPDPGPGPDPVRYEAESATISQGTVDANHAGFTGTGFVNYANAAGSFVEWPGVNVADVGTATLRFRYANGSSTNRPLDVSVNGTVLADEVAFGPTGSWTTWQTVTVTVPISQLSSAVRATATTAGGGPNLDSLEVQSAAPPPPPG